MNATTLSSGVRQPVRVRCNAYGILAATVKRAIGERSRSSSNTSTGSGTLRRQDLISNVMNGCSDGAFESRRILISSAKGSAEAKLASKALPPLQFSREHAAGYVPGCRTHSNCLNGLGMSAISETGTTAWLWVSFEHGCFHRIQAGREHVWGS